MSTISVPLSKEEQAQLNTLVESGVAPNRAAVMRKALGKLAEAEAVEAVLRAQREPTLKGDIRTLMRKIK